MSVTGQFIPGLTNLTATLPSTYTFSTANGTFGYIGLSLTLAQPGWYKITAQIRTQFQVTTTAGGFITVRFNDGSAIAGSERMAYGSDLNKLYIHQVPMELTYHSTVVNQVVVVEAATFTGTAWFQKVIASDTSGQTQMFAHRIA